MSSTRNGAARADRSRGVVRRSAGQAFGLVGAAALVIATFGVAVGVAVETSVAAPHVAAADPAPSAVIPNSAITNYQDITFGPNDDGTYPCGGTGHDPGVCGAGQSTPTAVPLGFNMNFDGAGYSNVFVNNNGNLTFDSPLSDYTPFGLQGTNHVIIAPFFADVDTELGGGVVNFGQGTLNGHNVFVANWPGVTCYNSGGSGTPVDNFQVILIDRPDLGVDAQGDSFQIEFNYQTIQWDAGTASGGNNACAAQIDSESAAAGFSNGTSAAGASYQLPGSQSAGAFLDSNASTGLINHDANSTVPGQYVYNVVNGTPIQTTTPTTTTVSGAPNPSMVNQPVTVTATVTGSDGGGTVAFSSGGSTLTGCAAVPLSGSTAVCTDAALPVGSDTVTASYGGDTASAVSTGTFSQVVNAPPPLLSSVTLNATPTANSSSTSTPAGIGTVLLDNNGSLPTVSQQTSTTGSSSTGLNGSPNAAVASTKIGAIKIGAIKIGAIKMGAIKIGAIKMGAIALGSQNQDIKSLSNALLSNIGVTYPDGCAGSSCTDWKGILAGSKYAGFPLQTVSLENVLTTTGSDAPDNSNPAARLNSLPLSDINIDGSSLGALPVAAYALGGTSIDNIPLNSADLNPDRTVNQNQTLTDWCNDLNGVHWPCSDFGITSNTDTADAANVTVLSLGIAGVPLASIPLNTIPLGSTTVDGTAIAGLSLAGTSLNDTGLGATKIGAIKIGAIKMGAIPIDEVKMGAIKMGAIPLEDLKMGAINLGTLKMGAIPLQGTKMGAIKIGAIPLAGLKMGAIKIGAIKMGAISMGGILLSSLSNLSNIVDCSKMPDNCSGVGDTLAQAEADGAIQPGADLQTLQAGITEPNAAWDATALADVDGSDSSNPGADQTTLADLVALANTNQTFAQVFAVAVLADVAGSDPTTSVADIEAALNGFTDDTTLAGLLAAEQVDSGTTIGQLIDELASDDPSAFNGLFLGDLLAGLLPESTFPWQDVNLSTPGLAAASTGGGEVTLTATTVVLNGPTALTEVLTVPAGFSLVPGSATFDGHPTADPTVSGDFLTANPGSSTGTDTYTVEVRPNEVLGNQPVSVTASIPDGGTQSAGASIDITDPFAGNGSPTTPSTLQPDSLNVSFLSAPNVSAYWDINVPAGDALSLDLSDLPADYDMVLYGPPTTQLSSTPTQNTAGVTDTPPADQSSTGQQNAPAQGALPLLSNLPVQAVSANRGLTPEQITTPSLTGGTYLVQITGFNGAYSTTAPYALRSQLIQTAASPSCSAPNTYANDALTQHVAVPASGQPLVETWSASGGWALQGAPSGVNTIFLVNPDRLYDAYGQSSSGSGGQPGVNDVLQQLTSTINSGAGGMVGAIVPVEGNAQTAADYTAWDASPCSVQAANKVAADISATVRNLESTYSTISNIVVVGADDQVPMARVPDTTVSDNESDYAASTLPGINNQLSSALSEGYFLSDDPYASPNPLGVGGQTLYTPSLAIGRLVETPTQIDNALSRFQSSDGLLNAKTGLSTGYDFLTQGANAIAASLSGPLGAANVTKLISNSWSKSDLLNALDGGTPTNPASAPTVGSINAHFDFGRALSALGDQNGDNSEILSTTDVRNADPNNEISQQRLLLSLGCHSGLDIPTNEISNVVPGGVDSWASTFADEGAIWVGNTGYGYANDQYISYSAKLMGLLAQSLNGSVSIGDALSQAKQLYAAQTGVLDPYDLKADMESTYYGMPNYTLSGLTNPSTNSAATTPQLTLGHDPATSLQTASVTLNQSTGTGPNQLGTVTPPEGGTYYEVNNSTLEQTTAGFPIEPLSSMDVTIPGANGTLGSVAHGALITGLTSTDIGNFTPSIAEADSDTSGPENQISQYETSFPATLQRVATYQLFTSTGAPVSHQAVDLVTGQFVPDPNNPGTGNQRLFTSISSNVEYTQPSDTNFTPPTINEATGIVVTNPTSSSANFNVVTTPAPGGSPVKEVLVLFTDTTNPGAWTPVHLTLGDGGAWTGGAPAPASGKISYIVQAVDGDGNVSMDSNKGVAFNQVQPSQVQSTGLGGGLSASLSGIGGDTEVDGFFNGPADLTFTGSPGATVTYQVDGGASHTVGLDLTGQGSITVLGDGTHLITASDPGNQISQVVQIDTTPPTVTTSVSAPKSGNGWTSGGSILTVSASDTGSGVSSLTYQAAGGAPTTVTGPITVPSGQTTYTLTATDFVGNTSSVTVTTQVDTTAPSVTCAGPDTNWHATDQSVTCSGTDTQSGIAGGTSSTGSITLSTSVPTGTTNASASTAAGQICDNVGNCTPIPPISGFKIDKAAPVINCPSADANWHSGTVSFTCTAGDAGSGLANSAQASITLSSLPVAAGAGNGNDSTNSVQVCDKVGNCAIAGPITGIKIDNSAPTITIANPTNNVVYTLNQPETATYSCASTVSGIASCTAVSGTTSISSGGTLPTNQVGSHTIKVTATSKAGQTTTLTYTYVVTYKLCNVVGPIEPLGAAVLFSVTLCSYSGANVGASNISITALNVDGTKAPKPVLGNTWLWIPVLKVYTYAMLSSGLAKGSHVLNVSVTGDPVTHALSFSLK